jgi:hypothetical protein
LEVIVQGNGEDSSGTRRWDGFERIAGGGSVKWCFDNYFGGGKE